MKFEFSQVRWGRVLLAGVLAAVLSIVLFFLVVTVYATILAFQVRGTPNQAQINQFASQAVAWDIPTILAILLTFGGAVWAVRKVARDATTLNGLLVGLVAAIILLIYSLTGGFNLTVLVTFVLIVAAGWLGGVLGSRGRVKS